GWFAGPAGRAGSRGADLDGRARRARLVRGAARPQLGEPQPRPPPPDRGGWPIRAVPRARRPLPPRARPPPANRRCRTRARRLRGGPRALPAVQRLAPVLERAPADDRRRALPGGA